MIRSIPPRAASIAGRLGHPGMDADRLAYLAYHAPRYAALVDAVGPLIGEIRGARAPECPRLLDVGVGFQTALLRELVPDGQVDTLGFADPLFPTPDGTRHVAYDLNDARLADGRPALDEYDLVTLCETLEHLWVGPATVLGVLREAIAPGGFLVVQTPNAVALHKRLRMIAGRPPIAPLPEGDRPGFPHLHEYTVPELVGGAERAGFTLREVRAANYFGSGPAARIYGVIGRMTPPSLRHGLTVTFTARP